MDRLEKYFYKTNLPNGSTLTKAYKEYVIPIYGRKRKVVTMTYYFQGKLLRTQIYASKRKFKEFVDSLKTYQCYKCNKKDLEIGFIKTTLNNRKGTGICFECNSQYSKLRGLIIRVKNSPEKYNFCDSCGWYSMKNREECKKCGSINFYPAEKMDEIV